MSSIDHFVALASMSATDADGGVGTHASSDAGPIFDVADGGSAADDGGPGTIPQFETPHWTQLNTFRTQAQVEGGVCQPEPEG